MRLLATGWLMLGSACLGVVLIYSIVWVRGARGADRLWLAVAALGGAGNAFSELWMSGASSVAEFETAFRWSNIGIAVMLVGLAWFTVSYTGSRRSWLAWLVTAGWGLAVLVDRVVPASFGRLDDIERITMPWGEVVSVGAGGLGIGNMLGNMSVVALMLLVLWTVIDTGRRGSPRHAVLFGAILFFLITGVVQATLVDTGILEAPYLISYLFGAIVLATGYELAGDVVRAATLSREIRARELRWRELTKSMHLLVVSCDAQGGVDHVNPHFCETSGYRSDEIVGRPYLELLREEDRPAVRSMLEAPDSGAIEPYREYALLTRGGEVRNAFWSSLPRYDSNGLFAGTLNVGVDVTGQRAAESQRDTANEALGAALARIDTLDERLAEESLQLDRQPELEGEFSEIVGDSDALKYVLHRVEQVARADSTVLVLGETGVGKELIARAVHDRSPRATRPFVKVNCAALPASLIESELFGHERGAFTGAERQRRGRFELADGGTILLDEVAELPPELQTKLLRVLQEGEFERVGGSVTLSTDIRVIASTNRDLDAEVAAGRFRKDLFYRLHVYPITVPPLRQRRDDVPLLVKHFIPRLTARLGRRVETVPAAVMRELQEYDWPGNVRELQNVLEYAMLTSTDAVLRLPERLQSSPAPAEPGSAQARTLEEVERLHILEVLRATHGQVAGHGGAAEILGVPASTLRSRMKKLDVRVERSTRTGPQGEVDGRDISRRRDPSLH